MLRRLPGCAARERSVDPDALLQELRLLAESEDAEMRRAIAEADADAALAALKERMAGAGPA
jgi:hypothetical protein